MKIESQILIFILILNLSVLMVTDLGDLGVIPGVTYTQQLNATGTRTDIQERFNATDEMETWEPETQTGVISILGDLIGGVAFFFKQIIWVVAGFPIFLWDLGAVYITDTTGLLVWGVISGTIAAVFSIYMCWFVFQIITSREVNQ